MFKKAFLHPVLVLLFVSPLQLLAQLKYEIQGKEKVVIIRSQGKEYQFSGNLTIIFRENDPKVALRPAGITGVSYNVPTWLTYEGKASDLKKTKTSSAVGGDGLDDSILKSNQKGRTVSIYNAGETIETEPNSFFREKDVIKLNYPENELFSINATLTFSESTFPVFEYVFRPKVDGYFSVGYTGAQKFGLQDVKEIWQPLIWQEKRFPDNAYLTPSYMATLPTTFVNDGENTIGVMALQKYLPFNPLPLFENSQFGISVRDNFGKVKNQIFSPIMGGFNSKMKKGNSFNFGFYLVVEPKSITYAYENIARKYFGFKDFRTNDISSVNQTLEHMTDYALSNYAWFVDSLKGCAYSTDVPGAVKNVSSLNPLELAIVLDNKQMFEKRAYPTMEFMLSREKTLFSLDSTQKIQSPSRKLDGSVASVSELTSLYRIFDKDNPFLLAMAKEKMGVKPGKDVDGAMINGSWIDAMNVYKANGNPAYLQKAVTGANDYLKERVDKKQLNFSGSSFFWTAFTNKWINLLDLYELTGDKEYLKAAHEGARYYTMFTWMSPAIPDSMVTVNKDNKAPLYWYLKSKGHKQMYYPEEKAPSWRLSEIGLTPESSGTSAGHRAIFMANYAPWMLRIGYYTNDSYLKEVAKAAIIGRYRNFPGYHINTARTTAYEKLDFPLHKHKELSVNSFHYNHIMPMASMLLDYMVTEAFTKSHGEINFPSEYIEGYAYLQNKFYGSKKGRFYNEKDIQLWMPSKLLAIQNVELNYISGRKGKDVYVAFMNQSPEDLITTVTLNDSLLTSLSSGSAMVYNDGVWKALELTGYTLDIDVKADGLKVIKLVNVSPGAQFQEKLLTDTHPVNNDYLSLDFGHAQAMLIKLGDYASRAFIYLKDDDSVFSEVKLNYTLTNGKKQTILKKEYPFEFTVDMPVEDHSIKIQLEGKKTDGKTIEGKWVTLGD